jgi:sensor domain CHASE-containing protein
MSFTSYWMVFVGIAMATLVSLAIFSMLSMASQQEENQDIQEMELVSKSNDSCQSGLWET